MSILFEQISLQTCDPTIEVCGDSTPAEVPYTGLSSLWQITILYMMNCALLPFLGLTLLPFGLSIWSSAVWGLVWALDLVAFLPSSVMNMLAIFFDGKRVLPTDKGTEIVVGGIDILAASLMEWGTANASLVVWSVGGLALFFLWLLNITSLAYIFLWLAYVAAGFGTQYLQIKMGEEVIKTLNPYWTGSKSGLFWAKLYRELGLVDKNDLPIYLEHMFD